MNGYMSIYLEILEIIKIGHQNLLKNEHNIMKICMINSMKEGYSVEMQL